MEKVGLIGYGSWGKLLYKKLDTFCDVEFTCRSKDTYFDKLDSVNFKKELKKILPRHMIPKQIIFLKNK